MLPSLRDNERWVWIVGDARTGKSTLLQSLAPLEIVNTAPDTQWPQSVHVDDVELGPVCFTEFSYRSLDYDHLYVDHVSGILILWVDTRPSTYLEALALQKHYTAYGLKTQIVCQKHNPETVTLPDCVYVVSAGFEDSVVLRSRLLATFL